MRFVRGENKHSDGEGGFLGRVPRAGGDIFFDDEENWSLDFFISNFGETNLLAVTLHEIGHAIGLIHSEKSTALMGKALNRPKGEVRLDVDDVQAIQALYGAPGLPRPQDDEMREVDIETGNLM